MLLRRWWTQKYTLPWTHDSFQSSTEFDLLVEFYEDVFEKDPAAMFEAGKGEDGEIMFGDTGDPMIDKWEAEFAKGLVPDLGEGMTNEAKDRLGRLANRKRSMAEGAKKLDSIDETYGPTDPRLASKFVQVGSMEEKRLLNEKLLDRVGRPPDSYTLGDRKLK